MANLTLRNSSGGTTSVTADEFLGTSSFTKLLQLYDPSNGSSTGIGSWTPDANYTYVYKQGWLNSNMNADSGDLCLGLRNNNNGGLEVCMFIDGDYYSMGNKVLNEGNYSSYALPLAGGTMNGTIWSTHVYPKATMSYNFGSSEYEYNATFSRTVFVRHIEPAKNVNDDIYINYGSRSGTLRICSNLSMEGLGNIQDLPINGGIYWNPYVESSGDPSDACSIKVVSNGYLGGTELQIQVQNDANDCINLLTPSWILLNGKSAFRVDDSWLRINETGGFSSGIYCGSSEVRTDNCFRIGNNGSAFGAYNNGEMWCSYRLIVGDKGLCFWKDVNGGNIGIASGNGHTNNWQIDSYNGNLRIWTQRESDGTGQSNTLYQEDGCWDKCHNADTVKGINFYWSGQGGQPTWLWGGEDGVNMYVYNPLNFNVNSSAYIRATLGNYNAGGLFYGNSSDSVDGSGSWTNWIQFGTTGDWHSRLSFPYWSYPRYTRYYADSGSYTNWNILHSTENIKVQSEQPTGEFYGQIWLKI